MSKRSVLMVGVFVLMVIVGTAEIDAFSGLASTAHANGEYHLFLPLICRPFQCEDDPIPPGGACPSECTSCVEGKCIIDCVSNTCRDSTINCPSGFECEVICAYDYCQMTTINCPDFYTCRVICDGGYWGCEDLAINCSSEGMCSLVCEAVACSSTLLNCGNDACLAECLSSGNCFPIVDCGNSCSCTVP